MKGVSGNHQKYGLIISQTLALGVCFLRHPCRACSAVFWQRQMGVFQPLIHPNVPLIHLMHWLLPMLNILKVKSCHQMSHVHPFWMPKIHAWHFLLRSPLWRKIYRLQMEVAMPGSRAQKLEPGLANFSKQLRFVNFYAHFLIIPCPWFIFYGIIFQLKKPSGSRHKDI